MKKIILLVCLFIFIYSGIAIAHENNDHHGRGMRSWHSGIRGWIMFPLMIGCAVFFMVHFFRKNHSTKETPLDILQKRYAKGEIDKEEYERIKKEL